MNIQILIDTFGKITLSSRRVMPIRRNGGIVSTPQRGTALRDVLPSIYPRMEEDVEAKLLWNSVREQLSPKQRRMVELRADGLTDAELARVFRLQCADIPAAFDRIRSIALECMGL